jgi:uncharacterized membrane protein YcaP (DUF421 family)
VTETLLAAGWQMLLAAAYYTALLGLFRLAGKRLAGQTTTYDLVVLIGLAVVLQQTTLRPGLVNAVVFVGTVFSLHQLVAGLCARSRAARRLFRGAARPLVRNGHVSLEALAEEKLSYEDLLAGLRKVGFADPADVRLATLEETGHISAVGGVRRVDDGSNGARESA